MPIVWTEDLSVGEPTIDGDHKQLIAIINAAEEVINASGSRREIERILDRLETYTRFHFDREEAIQRRVNYPFAELHHQQHLGLIETLQEIRGRFRAAKDAYAYESVISGLVELLRDWLLKHVVNADLRMRPFVKSASS